MTARCRKGLMIVLILKFKVRSSNRAGGNAKCSVRAHTEHPEHCEIRWFSIIYILGLHFLTLFKIYLIYNQLIIKYRVYTVACRPRLGVLFCGTGGTLGTV